MDQLVRVFVFLLKFDFLRRELRFQVIHLYRKASVHCITVLHNNRASCVKQMQGFLLKAPATKTKSKTVDLLYHT